MVAVKIYDRISNIVNQLELQKLQKPAEGEASPILKASARCGKIHRGILKP